MTPTARGVLGWIALSTPICLLVFLLFSSFFDSWDGYAVSVRPSLSDTPAVYRVLIAERGRHLERDWSASAVDGLALPIDALALPPRAIDELDRPQTKKSRFSLQYSVERPDGWVVVPTTSPQALGVAIILWLLSFGVRNMIVGGSPLHFAARATRLPKAQQAAGVPTQPARRAPRSKKGPPPGPGKKRRRRR